MMKKSWILFVCLALVSAPAPAQEQAPAPQPDAVGQETNTAPEPSPPKETEREGPPEAALRQVRLVLTGETMGFSSWSTNLIGPYMLLDHFQTHPGELVLVGITTAMYSNGKRLLYRSPTWTVREFKEFLAAGPYSREVLDPEMPLAFSPYELTFEWPRPAGRSVLDLMLDVSTGPSSRCPDLERQKARMVRLVAKDGKEAVLVELEGQEEDQPLPTSPEEWEVRFFIQARVFLGDRPSMLFTVGRPNNEGSRRAALLKSLRAAPGGDEIIWIDAGGLLEGPSFLESDENLQWPTTWKTASQARLDIMVPGKSELRAGLERIGEEAGGAGVALVSANLLREDSPVFERYRLMERDGLLVGVLGLSDPNLVSGIHPERLAGAELVDPAAAIKEALSRMKEEAGTRPDLVVVAGNLSDKARAELPGQLRDVDLILLADRAQQAQQGPLVIQVPSGPVPRSRQRYRFPLLTHPISRTGIDEVVVRFTVPEKGPPEIREVEVIPRPVTDEMPRDMEVSREVMRVRQDVYDQGEVMLLPDVDPIIRGNQRLVDKAITDPEYRHLSVSKDPAETFKRFPARFTDALWTQLIASILKRQFDAEVSLVEPFRQSWHGVGPTTRLLCQANLASDSMVQVHLLPGSMLARLARSKLGFEWLGIAGMTPDGSLVAGRPIRDNELYKVVTTDLITAREAFQALAGRGGVTRGHERFVETDEGFLRSEAGTTVTVRRAVFDVLEARRRADPALGPATAARLEADLLAGGETKISRWVLDIKELTAGMEYHAPPSTSGKDYSQVSEPRVQAEEHRRLATRADVIIEHDTRPLVWVTRGYMEFTKDYFEESEYDLETADDLLGETELRLAFLSLSSREAEISLLPSMKLTYDTELTPMEDSEKDETLPRQQLIRASLGMAASGSGALKLLRLGLLVQGNIPEEKTEIGLGLELDHRLPLGPMLWTNSLDARYLLPDREHDTAADLGVRIAARSALRLPLIEDFSFLAYADIFAFKGKVEQTDSFGLSSMLGLGVSYSRFWKPGYQPLIR